MTKLRLLIPGAAVLAFMVLLPAGCSDDGTGPGNGNGNGTHGNPVAAAFKAVAEGADAILTENEELFASLAYFGPQVGTTLGASPNASDAARASCIPASKHGKVFTWDPQLNRYTGKDSSMAPPEGAVYILYRVVNGELEDPPVETGYIEAECEAHEFPDADSLAVTLYNTGGSIPTEVAFIEFKGLFYATQYYIRPSRGTLMGGGVQLVIEVSGEGETGGESDYIKENFSIDLYESFHIPILEGSDAGIGLWDMTLDSQGMPTPGFFDYGAGAHKSGVFNCSVRIGVNDEGMISNINGGEKAPLEFEDRVGDADGVLACFSGVFDDAAFLNVEASDVDGGCATGVINTPIPLGESDLGHIKNGYIKLWRMFDNAITPMWVASVNMVMTP
jgi:hypothetical protein